VINQRGSLAIFEANAFYGNTISMSVSGSSNQIKNNLFTSGGTDIRLYGSNNVVEGNYLSGSTAKINIQSGTHTIQNNIGYITENTGTTSAGTQIQVSHGLVGTPTRVVVTPLGQTNSFYVHTKTPTTFSITSASSVAFDWHAEV